MLSQRAYAKHRGCRLNAVQKAIKSGRISLVEGKIDPEKADRDWQKNTDPAKQGAKVFERAPSLAEEAKPQAHGDRLKRRRSDGDDESGSDAADYLKAKAEKEQALAELKKLELEERRGELVDVTKVNAWMAGRIVRCGTIHDRIVDELPDRLAQMTDAIQIKALLRRELDRARTELAEYSA